MSLKAEVLSDSEIGYFRIFAQPPGGRRREITMFRDAPIDLGGFSTADPFSETTASLSFPQITLFDNPGYGDLDWLVRDCNIDIVWENYGPYDYVYSWEGFIVSMDMSMSGGESSFTVELKGALFGLDNFLAKPTFPRRPIPYEVLITRAFDQKAHPCGLKPLQITFPSDWDTKVKEYRGPKSYQSTLRPAGLVVGQNWTGLTSRNTGSWEPVLSGHVQSLLSVMFDEGGAQWTIRNQGSRRPHLFLRKQKFEDDQSILNVTIGGPGVDFTASKDFSQSANIIYGQGKDEAGITFSGMAVSPKGNTTYFRPYAHSPLTFPREDNPILDKKIRPKETMIRFQDGVDELSATRVAEGQFQRFSEPGFTGQITLSTDPITWDGKPFPRFLIKAGRTLRVKGLQGMDSLLVHVTQTTVDPKAQTIQLTYDSKYRDVLTVDEVRARTRDALSPLRSLQVGKFSNTIQDLLEPWNYNEGSGVVPSGAGKNAKDFFLNKIPATAQFPYEQWTVKYPPKDYPNYYIKIGPTDTDNATNNWAKSERNGNVALAQPVKMGFSGEIRLTQIAAYNKHGQVMPVRFHVSFYWSNGVGPGSMPVFYKNPDDLTWLKPKGISVTYKSGQSYPFIRGAWEQVQTDGTIVESNAALVRPNSGFVVGWGSYFEPAGYSPGRFSHGAPRTGMLVDESSWTWDLSKNFSEVDADAPPQHEYGGSLFVNIYCDEQGDEPVYFMGRLFRKEPGTQ